MAHLTYGNRNKSHYKVLKINSSNVDFCSKLHKLQSTINSNLSEIIIISESTPEITNPVKMDKRKNFFKEINFEDKIIPGFDRSRLTIMIHKNIKYTRFPEYEDQKNTSVAIKVKDGKGKWVHIMGIYRQWKQFGEFNANNGPGIKRQVSRLKKQCENIANMCDSANKFLLGGDIHIDKCSDNDPHQRPEIKDLSPIWDKRMLKNGLAQVNFENTWHRPGKRSSLLDLFYTTDPNNIDGVENTVNTLSEHDAMKINLHTNENHTKP